ncbi:hypothetical protein LCGC14_0377850 [marine sediment metagenome]|uniref:PD-(D/E)XK endonuclease-like domain-containing protein n=1 Tax=marine sediment metagenome TaxID=412755 RepID=A0A0F9TL79_9ZZZZ
MKKKRPLAFVWPTWITKLITGEDNCFFKSWLKSHYQNYDKTPSDFNSAMWNIAHTKILRSRVDMLTDKGYRVLIEDQNSFKLDYCSNAGDSCVISAKPDILALGQCGDGTEFAEISDAKSGKQKSSDQLQVMLYQILLPLAVSDYAATKFSGCVVYKEGVPNVDIPNTIADDKGLREQIFSTIDKIIGPEVACRKTPSKMECRFCDIARSECSAKFKE